MSRKGGYKIIDLKGYDFTNADMVIDGIYDTIESNYGKPLLFTGIVIDGIEKDDVYAMVETIGSTYRVTLYDKVVTISDLDVVSSKNNPIEIVINTEDYEFTTNGKYLVSFVSVPECTLNIGTRIFIETPYATPYVNTYNNNGTGTVGYNSISLQETMCIILFTYDALYITGTD